MTFSRDLSRRQFLGAAATAPFLARYHQLAAAERKRVKIRDIQTMVMQGPRTYTLVKVVSDAGIYGIGEAYGSPGVGVKEQILRSSRAGRQGSAGDRRALHADGRARQRASAARAPTARRTRSCAPPAASRWRCGTWPARSWACPRPRCSAASFRDRVRVYDHAAPRNMLDKASCREWAQKVKADPSGFTAHKFGFPHTNPESDDGRDPSNRVLSTKELIQIRQGFENCREAIGWDHDIMVHCHWEYDLRTSIQLAQAVEPIKPLWLEDPLPVDYSDSWKRLVASSNVPICTGENLARRQGFKDFIINQGCDILHPDLRNTGGFLETKRIADMAAIVRLADGDTQHGQPGVHVFDHPMGRVHPRLHGVRDHHRPGRLDGPGVDAGRTVYQGWLHPGSR